MPGKSHIHTHNDFEVGKRAGWLDDLKRRCSCCSAEMAWKFPGCSACGTLEPPLLICPDCDRSVESATLDYRAVGSTGNQYLTTIAGDQCPNCLKTFAYWSFVSELDDFIESVPHDLKILPEIGVQTSERLEVLVSVLGDETEGQVNSDVVSGLSVEVGPQSELFQKCLERITVYDTGDYGHEFSQTLVVCPGPPYSAEHRQEIQLLLSRLCRSLGISLDFWSINFEPPWHDVDAPLQTIAAVLETCPLDQDRVCLALVNQITAGAEPNKLVNTFRLVETVTNRILDRALQKARFDTNVTHEVFLNKVRLLQADLKTRLRHVVADTAGNPDPILRKLWRLLEPRARYSGDEVFHRIARFRNRAVHAPGNTNDNIALPWEAKPFRQAANHILELVAYLLQNGGNG